MNCEDCLNCKPKPVQGWTYNSRPSWPNPKPAPEDIKKRLEEAGAKSVIPDMGTLPDFDVRKGAIAFVYRDGYVLHIYTDSLPRAEAALRASRGEDCRECADFGKLLVRDEKLAAANAEIERLKGEIAEAREWVRRNAYKYVEIEKQNAWLARNKPA